MTPTALIDTGDRLVATAHGATAVFTGRAGGTSEVPYDSLNLGTWTQDDRAAKAANQAIVQGWASEDQPRELLIGRQIHETVVVQHREGFPRPEIDGVDGHVGDRTDVALAVLTADCVPVLLLAPWGVGAAHAGWRGLAGGILAATTDELLDLPGADEDLSRVVALIGPCAGACCYEVGEEVHFSFEGWPVEPTPGVVPGENTIDLPALATAALTHAGVGEIVSANRCTICDPRYFSHRASGGTTGRQAGVVWRTA